MGLERAMMRPPHVLTAAGCYVIVTAAILFPVVCCIVTEATKDARATEKNGSPTTSNSAFKSVILESSSSNSTASRASVLLGLTMTPPLSPGPGSTQPETKSFRDVASSNVSVTGRDSFASRNVTPSSVGVIWSTASHAEVKLRPRATERFVHSPEGGSNSSMSRPKIRSGSEFGSETGSEFGSRTELHKTTDFLFTVLGNTSNAQVATTTDNYDYNNYNDDNAAAVANEDEKNDEDDDSDDKEKEMGDAESRDDAYGYSDRGEESQTYDDYRGGGRGGMAASEEEDSEGGGGGRDESRTEYLYVSTDNFTNNDSQMASKNQDLQQDYDDYNPSSDQSRDESDNGQRFRGSLSYEAENRDYHLGIEHHNFDHHLGEKISDMRSGLYRGQSISLRWLEHHPINHFTVFLWLVAALAFVTITMIAYRFRHSVVNAMQCTRVNYKQGKRFGVEEANDLLSNAQV